MYNLDHPYNKNRRIQSLLPFFCTDMWGIRSHPDASMQKLLLKIDLLAQERGRTDFSYILDNHSLKGLCHKIVNVWKWYQSKDIG